MSRLRMRSFIRFTVLSSLALDVSQVFPAETPADIATQLAPMLACGGIVGLLATRPDDRENSVSIRMVSARCFANRP